MQLRVKKGFTVISEAHLGNDLEVKTKEMEEIRSNPLIRNILMWKSTTEVAFFVMKEDTMHYHAGYLDLSYIPGHKAKHRKDSVQ